MHGVTVVFFQLCGVVILTRSQQALRETQAPYIFRPDFVASLDLRRDLFSPTKHHLCRIQDCSITYATYVCIFNHLWHNWLTFALSQVIRLNLVSIRGQGDKDHSVPNVSTGPITWSKTKKIEQTFILHMQNWISSIQPLCQAHHGVPNVITGPITRSMTKKLNKHSFFI